MPIQFPKPMLASGGGRPFSNPDWLYEIKFDGYRCLAGIELGQVELRTRNLANCTGWYPEAARALAAIGGGPHLLDGEVACLDSIGRSDFEKLHTRSLKRRWYAGCDLVTYCAFDLLVHNGEDLMNEPLTVRKQRLAALLGGVSGVLLVGDLPAEAPLFQQIVEPLKLEGLVAKRRDSRYVPGQVSADWLKIKRAGWNEGRTWRK